MLVLQLLLPLPHISQRCHVLHNAVNVHVKTKGKSHPHTSTSPVSFSFSTKLSASVSGPASSRRYRGYSVRGSFWKSTARGQQISTVNPWLPGQRKAQEVNWSMSKQFVLLRIILEIAEILSEICNDLCQVSGDLSPF